MRILVISNLFYPDGVGGYELGAFDMAQYLYQRGHEVVVLTSEYGYYLQDEADTHDAFAGLKVYRTLEPVYHFIPHVENLIPEEKRRRDIWGLNLRNINEITKTASIFRPDCIFLFNPIGLGVAGVLYICSLIAPSVIFLMDHIDSVVLDNVGAAGESVLNFIMDAKKRMTAIACSNMVMVTNSEIGQYREYVKIPLWVKNVSCYGRQVDHSSLKKEKEIQLVHFGQLEKHKGLGNLLEAVELLYRKGISLSLHIYGKHTPYSQELLHRYQALIKQGAVNFHGSLPKEELLRTIVKYDLAIFPTHPREAFGFVVAEAMAVGLPVVATHPIGSTEYLQPGEHFYPLMPNSDGREIAAQLLRIIEERNRWKMISENGRARAVEVFNLEFVGAKVEDLLSRVVKDNHYKDFSMNLSNVPVEMERAWLSQLALERFICSSTNFAGPKWFRYRLADYIVERLSRGRLPVGLLRDKITRFIRV